MKSAALQVGAKEQRMDSKTVRLSYANGNALTVGAREILRLWLRMTNFCKIRKQVQTMFTKSLKLFMLVRLKNGKNRCIVYISTRKGRVLILKRRVQIPEYTGKDDTA